MALQGLTIICVILSVVQDGSSKDVSCAKRTKTTVTVGSGDSFTFKTQRGSRYISNTRCNIFYKIDSTCKKIGLSCSSSNIINRDKRRCRKGDKLIVKAGRKSKVYCRGKKPTGSGTSLKLSFSSDRKKNGPGASCTVKCTQSNAPPPIPDDCKCGLAQRVQRIVGGTETEKNEYPWQVGMVDRGGNFVWCGGSLINEHWVLTAAHCVDDVGDIQILLGEHDYYNKDDTKVVRASVQQIISHPKYDKQRFDYDFALIKLQSPVDFGANSHIRPACLPANDSQTYEGQRSIVTGWGGIASGGPTSNVLLETNVNILSNSACKNNYNYAPSKITERMLCAFRSGADACQGDSGGPLVASGGGDGVTPGQNYDLVGVVSFGTGCASPNYPGVYARVTEVLPWIEENTGASRTCPRI